MSPPPEEVPPEDEDVPPPDEGEGVAAGLSAALLSLAPPPLSFFAACLYPSLR